MSIGYTLKLVYDYAIKRKEPHKTKQITSIRKTVCIMANELKKAGYSLSGAFKKAWKRVKLSIPSGQRDALLRTGSSVWDS